eukprot:TRINITY_DN26207_c0_g1_i1.p1 TRINITY_DN26207_c0_g1~~TRINITY_DN26207_c0_g1_i1.p1  ORF type:complete len:529 (+),score=119.36 TRINITY_DN26207_c0_g1_i1:40-1587(+)
MAKRGTYNGPFFGSFATRLRGTSIRFGTLIGATSPAGTVDLLFAAPTPSLPEAAASGDAAAAAAPTPGKRPVAPSIPELLKSKNAAGISFAAWAAQHRLALQRILPGGLDVCGCFLAGLPETAVRDLAPLLAPVLQGLAEPLVLTIDATSRKLSFWVFSGGVKPALRPAQLKSDPHRDATLLWTVLPVDLVIPYGDDAADAGAPAEDVQAGEGAEGLSASGAAAQQLRRRLKSFGIENRLSEALGACTATIRPAGDEDLPSSRDDAGAPPIIVDFGSEATLASFLQSCDDKTSRELRVDFFGQGTRGPLTLTPAGSLDSSASDSLSLRRLRCRCLIVAVALAVRGDLELRYVVEALRAAAQRSLQQRLELAVEEVEDGLQGTADGELSLPWRALCCPEDTELPLWCADACATGEDAASARARIGEFLGLPAARLRPAPVRLNEKAWLKHHFPRTYERRDRPSRGADGSAQGARAAGGTGGPKSTAGRSLTSLSCALAVAVAAVGVAVAAVLPRWL